MAGLEAGGGELPAFVLERAREGDQRFDGVALLPDVLVEALLVADRLQPRTDADHGLRADEIGCRRSVAGYLAASVLESGDSRVQLVGQLGKPSRIRVQSIAYSANLIRRRGHIPDILGD